MKAALTLAAALTLGIPLTAQCAAPTPLRFASAPAPAERFEVGGMLVERHGERGRPMILVPGLASGAWAWQGMVERFKGDHVLYVVTPAGFSGRAPLQGDLVAATRQALKDLIVQRGLKAPVLVGHSMGATLAIMLAQDEPALVGGVVAIDGLPVFPGTEDVPREQRAQMAAQAKASAAGMTPAMYEAQQKNYMRTIGSIDMARADDMAVMSSSSNPAVVTDTMASLLALDLRDRLATIRAPVLVIAPYYAPDVAQENISMEQKLEYYKTLMAGTPKLTVMPVSPARHFAMIDQPDAVASMIRDFVKTL
ncbi:alpha/beta fold hydrolase [Pseudoduganella sp. GCM10020061]|uniref:alpha/beta fold hydrolase n=1 Tax=Pseudoduganella sp. GCM10020061 TaxID=3317345 RepID=UPI003644A689